MLDLPSLAQRRLHTRLCYVYKIVHGLLYFPPDVVVPSSALSHNPRSHLLYQPFAHTNSYLHSFIPNSISNWNMLPDYVVSSLHLPPSNIIFHCLPCSRVHYLLAQLFVYPCCIIQQKFHRKKKKKKKKNHIRLHSPQSRVSDVRLREYTHCRYKLCRFTSRVERWKVVLSRCYPHRLPLQG